MGGSQSERESWFSVFKRGVAISADGAVIGYRSPSPPMYDTGRLSAGPGGGLPALRGGGRKVWRNSFIHSFIHSGCWLFVCEEAYIVEKVPDVKGKFTEAGQAGAVFKALRQNKNIISHRYKYIEAQ